MAKVEGYDIKVTSEAHSIYAETEYDVEVKPDERGVRLDFWPPGSCAPIPTYFASRHYARRLAAEILAALGDEGGK